ncbi:MAG: hypothetical protein ACLUHE_04115 [Christensenellales bacterium]
MADWYCPALGGVAGQERDAATASACNAGQTPIKTLGVTDQHCQLQLYTEGPFDKVITFLKVEKFRADHADSAGLRRHSRPSLSSAA